MKVQTPIGLADIHVKYKKSIFQVSAVIFYGALGNSEALSNQNRNISNALNIKRTPVGSAAIGGFIEAGFVTVGKAGLIKTKSTSDLILFSRYDYYDTQFRTEGLIFNNPRWERQSLTCGAVYKIISDVHIKFQYTDRIAGAPAPTCINGGKHERTFVTGFAFEF